MTYEGQKFNTFICYRGSSNSGMFGKILYAELGHYKNEKGDVPFNPFFAPANIPKGNDFKNAVDEVMEDVKYVLLVLTEGFFDGCRNDDDIVMHELRTALSYPDINFIPIILDDYDIAADDCLISLFTESEINRFKHISAVKFNGIYEFDTVRDLVPILLRLENEKKAYDVVRLDLNDFQYDGKQTVVLGRYPQNVEGDLRVTESIFEAQMNGETEIDPVTRWIKYDGRIFSSLAERPFNKSRFTDGKEVNEGARHFYRIEPIRWIVLFRNSEYAVLISQQIIDAVKFNRDREARLGDDNRSIIQPNNWERSDIREWLNESFLYTAFTLDERKRIVTVRLDNSPDSMYYKSEPQNDTEDKVFLVSHKEIYATKCGIGLVTDYAKARGAYASTSSSHYNHGDWWTRSPGNKQTSVENVDRRGCVDAIPFCNYVDDTAASVRPCIVVKL